MSCLRKILDSKSAILQMCRSRSIFLIIQFFYASFCWDDLSTTNLQSACDVLCASASTEVVADLVKKFGEPNPLPPGTLGLFVFQKAIRRKRATYCFEKINLVFFATVRVARRKRRRRRRRSVRNFQN